MALTDVLTKRQKAVYDFIRDKIRNRGYGPTVREIGDEFNIRSPNGVMCHLKAIEKKGLITREKNLSRAINLVREPVEERGLPLYGMIAAGVLHEAVEQDERIDFTGLFNKKNLFALKVIVRKQRTARKGQIVVAITEEGEATLKRWYPEANRIRLEPANSAMKPIYVDDARILGTVVGVVRQIE
jgi:repressor LexA